MPDDFAGDITRRCRWARKHNDGIPNPAWSTGERLFVALVLGDEQYLAGEEWTVAETMRRLAGELGAESYAEVDDWLAEVRGALEGGDDGPVQAAD
jgi:hypothetical protein